jgi:hypothetical protein
MLDQLVGDAHPLGFDWRSFKLTFLLREAFTSLNRLTVVVHAPPDRKQMSATLVQTIDNFC